MTNDDVIWTNEQDLQHLTLIGESIADRYEIERLLGQGGMGSVYLATDQLLTREVAIKLMKPDVVRRQNPVRFYHEARLLAKMNHPNIVTLYNCGWYHEQAYLVMEYVSGTLLSSLVNNDDKNSTLTIIEALQILSKVCGAVKYAHEHGVIHRDIKPGNVIVGDDVKLMDFGIAKMRENDPLPSILSMAEGTPLYVAPEQATGGDADERSDIYSLGVVMYELLTGHTPFSATGDLSMVSQHIYVTPVAPHLRNSIIPEKVSRLIMKMLAKDPDSRPDSMDEVLKIFDSALMKVIPDQKINTARELPENLDNAKIKALRSIPLFASVTTEDLRDLSKKLIEKHYSKGETILEKDEPGSSLHIIRKGGVRIVLPDKDNNNNITLTYLREGDFFGEMSLLDDKPRSAGAISVEPTETLMLSRGVFLDFLKWYPDAALAVLGIMTQRVRDLNARLESISSQEPGLRLANTIRQLMENNGKITSEGCEIQLPLAVRDLAGMSGLGVARTTQIIRNLKATGILRSIGRHYTVLKPEILPKRSI